VNFIILKAKKLNFTVTQSRNHHEVFKRQLNGQFLANHEHGAL